ncbi:hypothetical protein DAH55_15910 [Sphingomonas koreensis]|uniref:sigma-70 region 4 domain-containing protein n=1 Tax=Sphingomonas koreensis TaxID=93064 RepID=UPI0008372D1C|nr:sigma-70 region 4 domain-containing protein [Sphingomonas koreensis]PJI87922.1 sigma-70-like protein [Sphingomonas koreensis]RSU55925.1 hypothetical protein DAH56_19670 [Sphingomonas koreensis]RSU66099.1 hypothetical protein DAH55_15910 [Sphingomonas koreensis]
MAQRAHDRLPDAELTPELIGARLDAMPELPRSVFLLRHLDGLEVAAIGAQLGMSIEAVERELARAIDVLIWGVAQAESLIRKRLPELGIRAREGASISHSIQDWLGLSRGRGLGR